MDHVSTQSPTVVAVDGGRRQLAVGEFGDLSGRPVFLLHGSLASWRYRYPDDGMTAGLGVRLVTIARPGFGSSTRAIGRTVASFADDVAAVADALGIDQFAVMGHSGGGPHALACGALLPARVSSVAAIGSLAPLDAPDRFAALGPMAQVLFESALGPLDDLERGLEAVSKVFLADPSQSVRSSFEGHADDHLDELVADLCDALACGVGGWADDLCALTRSWGFDLARPSVRTTLWYGVDDPLRPTHDSALAQALGCDLFTHPGGHQGWHAVWPELLESLR